METDELIALNKTLIEQLATIAKNIDTLSRSILELAIISLATGMESTPRSSIKEQQKEDLKSCLD